MIRSFIRANKRLCEKLEPRFGHSALQHDALVDMYKAIIRERSSAIERPVILDAGGGKQGSFSHDARALLVAVDIDSTELAQNRTADLRIAGDACVLPLDADSMDLVVSRTVVEHLPDVEKFVRESRRVIRPMGCAVHFFPLKWAVFSTLNRVLPARLARAILFALQPQVRTTNGFRAYYDNCTPSRFVSVLEANGFEIEFVRIGYYGARYFDFFVPLYLLVAAYERLVAALGIRVLGSFMLVVAKPMRDAPRAAHNA